MTVHIWVPAAANPFKLLDRAVNHNPGAWVQVPRALPAKSIFNQILSRGFRDPGLILMLAGNIAVYLGFSQFPILLLSRRYPSRAFCSHAGVGPRAHEMSALGSPTQMNDWRMGGGLAGYSRSSQRSLPEGDHV